MAVLVRIDTDDDHQSQVPSLLSGWGSAADNPTSSTLPVLVVMPLFGHAANAGRMARHTPAESAGDHRRQEPQESNHPARCGTLRGATPTTKPLPDI